LNKVNLFLSAAFLTAMMLTSFQGISQEVTIGNQVWMAKNLDVDKFLNGDPIPHAKTSKAWEKATKNGTPAWCYHKNVKRDGAKYGKLYNWYAVIDPRGLAPSGWHVPSYGEWTVIIDYLGGEEVAGTKMKSTDGWADYDGVSGKGTNESGFSGYPGGSLGDNGKYDSFGTYGNWWSTAEFNPYTAMFFSLDNTTGNAVMDHFAFGMGFSVRCLKD
jgi:uncharacterized protein (TIGR02145 family)